MFCSAMEPMRQTIWLQSTIPCVQWRRRKARVHPPLWFSMICGEVPTCICFRSMWPSGHTTKCTRVSYFLGATPKKSVWSKEKFSRKTSIFHQRKTPFRLITSQRRESNQWSIELSRHSKAYGQVLQHLLVIVQLSGAIYPSRRLSFYVLCCCTSLEVAFHKSVTWERWSMLRPNDEVPAQKNMQNGIKERALCTSVGCIAIYKREDNKKPEFSN